MATPLHHFQLDVEQQIIRIRKMIAESDKIQDERRKLSVETRIAPWPLTRGGMTAAATLFAGAAAFTKLVL